MRNLYVWYMGRRDTPMLAFRALWQPGVGSNLDCNVSVWMVPNLVNPYD